MDQVKVRFALDKQQWHGSETETLWAELCEGGLRRIDNVPFLVFGISFADVVKTRANPDGIEEFISVVRPGGHSTYRLIINGGELPTERLSQLTKSGCLYEIGNIGQVLLVSISVPPDSDINKIYYKFQIGEAEGIWDFEEANFEHRPGIGRRK